jgi:hypothetical protein
MTRPDHDLVAEDYIPSSSELARDQVALYEYRAKAGREIPILLLEPVNTTP